MAITIDLQPQEITPAYNSIFFVLSSNNYSQPGFNYLIQYTDNDSGYTVPLRCKPYNLDGSGRFELTKMVSNFVSYYKQNTTPVNSGFYRPLNIWSEYSINFKEEYQTSWGYFDYEFYGNTASIYNGYTQFRNNMTQSHTFVVGDVINTIQSDGGLLKPILNGIHTVVEVPDQYRIIIDLIFITQVGSGATIGGTCSYSDGRKTIFSGSTFSYVGYNASFEDLPFQSYNYLDYKYSTSSTSDFITSYPKTGMRVVPTQDFTFHIMNDYYNMSSGGDYLWIETSDNNFYRRNVITNMATTATYPFVGLGVGPNNISATGASGSVLPIIKTTTEWYDVYIKNSLNTTTMGPYRFYINNNCNIEDYEILFLDKMGAWSSFYFPLRSVESIEVTKKDFERLPTKWTKTISLLQATNLNIDNQKEIYHSEYIKKVKLRTAYMNDSESLFFKELITSGQHYIKKSNGVYVACIIDNKDFEIKRIKNISLIRYEIDVTYSKIETVNI